ncbi:MAG TPA: AraC family transcriptional regulator [Mobilitalea sp.]|nr:AraC family transcriptional regulator [Mobilitalea sp.]
MNTIDKYYNDLNKEFWESLHNEMLKANEALSQTDLFSYVERSFVFSLFFRGTSHKELSVFRNILNLKDLGYVIQLEFLPKEKTSNIDFDIDELALYYLIKNELKGVTSAVGPMLQNQISILVTEGPNKLAPGLDTKSRSICTAKKLIDAIHNKFNIKLMAGIGSVQSIHSINISLMEALSCMHYCNAGEIIHVQDLDKYKNHSFYEYKEAEKQMINAIRHRKADAYDYFSLIMNRIKHLSDDAKRNKIIEILVLATHAARLDSFEDADYHNYTCNIETLMELEGDQLIEWAFQKFVKITGCVRAQNSISIDYSNKIVQATKEYLEAHYAEEITLEDVAEYVNISPQYFSKLIKKNTGFNFIDWLSILRVKKAKELLANTSLTVKEVCFMVGYKDPNYFSRIFKKKIGMTPSEYVKNIKKITS